MTQDTQSPVQPARDTSQNQARQIGPTCVNAPEGTDPATTPKAASYQAAGATDGENTAPDGWTLAHRLAGRRVPPPPDSWPFLQVSPTTRVRLLDALNFGAEKRTPSGWSVIAYGRTVDACVASLRRRGLV